MTVGSAHQPLRSLVRDELRALVVTGELAPGTRIVEDRLAERLGVSRNPVREALQALAGEGFVELAAAARRRRRPDHAGAGRGPVRRPRGARAARGAAGRPARRRRRRRAPARGPRAGPRGHRRAASSTCSPRYNTEFHSLVVELSGNDYLGAAGGPDGAAGAVGVPHQRRHPGAALVDRARGAAAGDRLPATRSTPRRVAARARRGRAGVVPATLPSEPTEPARALTCAPGRRGIGTRPFTQTFTPTVLYTVDSCVTVGAPAT